MSCFLKATARSVFIYDAFRSFSPFFDFCIYKPNCLCYNVLATQLHNCPIGWAFLLVVKMHALFSPTHWTEVVSQQSGLCVFRCVAHAAHFFIWRISMRKLVWLICLFLSLTCFFAGCEDNVEKGKSEKTERSEETENSKENGNHVHSYGNWKATIYATCHQEGQEQRSCSCGKTESRSIDKLPYVERWFVADYTSKVIAYITTTNYQTFALEIYGSGEMDIDSYISLYGTVPWETYSASITSAIVGEGVTKLGSMTFYNCKNLTNVELPSTLIGIGEGAFGYCSKLKTVNIPNTVSRIERYAFHSCKVLESINIPSAVTYIGEDAFYDCKAIEKVYITDVSKWCAISFGGGKSTPMIYMPDLYVNNKVLSGTLNLSDSVKTIGKYSFYGCDITNVIISDSALQIGEYAFAECSKLTYVKIGTGVKHISATAFLDSALKEVIFENTQGWYWLSPGGSSSPQYINLSELYSISSCLSNGQYVWKR